MKNKYSITFFTISIVAMLLLTAGYQYSYHQTKQQTEHIQEEMYALTENRKSAKNDTDHPRIASEETVKADGEVQQEDCYYLMEINGYIVVYLSDRKTPYEYTDISYDDLPEKLRREIRNGKYIRSTEELYGFLENYSS